MSVAVKSRGILVDGTPGADVLPEFLAIAPGTIVTKCRVSAFSTTPLRTILSANGITELVILGVATGGVIVTTLREAADMVLLLHFGETCVVA